MAFKLGTATQPYAVGGEIRTKLKFDNVQTEEDLSVPGTRVILAPLPPETGAEANKDGNIYLNENIPPDSFMARKIVMHEMRHATDIKLGKLEYSDDYIKWNGETFARETRNDKDMIKVDGKWKEAGSGGFPWEKEANNGNGDI